jgi:hypothetical protein
MTKLLKAGLLAVVVLGMSGPFCRAVDQDAINKTIDKGVKALRSLQAENGTWPHAEIGATALAGLTLLECGATADDKAVLRAADAVRQASLTLTHNYSIALTILFLDRLGDPADIPLIESLTVRLLAGQTTTGGWNYQSPAVGEAEVRRLQNKLAQRKELTGRRELPKPGTVKRTAKDLPKEIQQQLAIRIGGGGQSVGSDNSNTQFVTLALWVGRRYGLPVETALKRVETRFRGSQHADGGWGYFEQGMMMRGPMAGSTASMTCAGLLGLAVADGNFSEKVREKKPDSKYTRDINKDPNLRRGLVALSTAIGQPADGARRRPGERTPIAQVGGRTYYFLWSLERVGVTLDLKTIGKKDWYAWGSGVLVANQQADGSWQGNYAACGADTCFALLFLKRANLVPDLTTQLTGKVEDPGERLLKGGGIGGVALAADKIADLKSGLESKDTKPPVEGKYPAAITKPLQDKPAEPKPAEAKRAEAQPVATKPADSVASRMASDLVKATGSRYTLLLEQMRDGKGADFSEALALAVEQLAGERQQKVRAALVERLTRMTDKTLTAYLRDEQPEIRRAAALACARKGNKPLIPQIIPLLREPRQPVREGAHEALKEMTGEDFGPAADANREGRIEAARKWLDWWNKQEKK